MAACRMQDTRKEDGQGLRLAWPGGREGLVTCEGAGREQDMQCPVGIVKEAGFYPKCHGKSTEAF